MKNKRSMTCLALASIAAAVGLGPGSSIAQRLPGSPPECLVYPLNGERYETDQDAPLNVSAPGVRENDHNSCGGAGDVRLVTDVAHGLLTLHADGSFAYQPDGGYWGGDRFEYEYHNLPDGAGGGGASNVGDVLLYVRPPCFAADDQYEVANDAELRVTAPGVMENDRVDCGELYTHVFSQPSNAQVFSAGERGGFTYVPTAGYVGPDSFEYGIYHRGGTRSALLDAAVVTIDVTDPPCEGALVDDTYSTPSDTVLEVAAPGIFANDELCGPPQTGWEDAGIGHVDVQGDGGFTYTPLPGFVGIDSFHYRQAGAGSEWATVTIDVTGPAAAPAPPCQPVMVPDEYEVEAGVALDVPAPGLLGNDTSCGLVADVLTQPSIGTLELHSNGAFVYSSPSDIVGQTSFEYQLIDADPVIQGFRRPTSGTAQATPVTGSGVVTITIIEGADEATEPTDPAAPAPSVGSVPPAATDPPTATEPSVETDPAITAQVGANDAATTPAPVPVPVPVPTTTATAPPGVLPATR